MYCQLKVYDWVFLVGFGCWGVLNTITEFYPKISKQVILFPLLYKELTLEEFDIMKPLINATYLIENNTTHSYFTQVPVAEFIKK